MDLESLKSWLKGQLTQRKGEQESWADLAYAIAEGIHEHVEGYLDRLKSRNSLFDMEKEDLLMDTIELRRVFPIGDVSDDDLAHTVMQRQDAVHFKKTVYPLVATLAREFSGMSVTWEPLYAPIDQEAYPYGTLFVTSQEMPNYEAGGLTPDKWFKTSRGVIRVPVNDVSGGETGVTEEDIAAFEEKVRRVIYPLVPLRIVCDGQTYYISMALAELVDFLAKTTTHITGDSTTTQEDEADIKGVQRPSDVTTTRPVIRDDGAAATPIYATPRLDSVPMDAIILDKVYY